MGRPAGTQRHLPHHHITYRTILQQGSSLNTDHLLFGLVTVGHKTPLEPGGAAADIGKDFGNPSPVQDSAQVTVALRCFSFSPICALSACNC